LWVRIPLVTRCTRYNMMLYILSLTCDTSLDFSG
jgi:hypothetical protein